MASKPDKKRLTSVGNNAKESSKRSPKSSPSPSPVSPKGSMGLGLLLIAIGTSLIGLGGLGYLFYQELLSSSRREVDRSVEAQVRQVEAKIVDVQQTVTGVANEAKSLSQQPAKPKGFEPYQKLLVDSLQKKESVAGMGIAQNENALFPAQKAIASYVLKEQSGLKLDPAGQKLAAPNDKLLSGSRPEIPSSKATLTKGKASWSEPYSALGKSIITYSAPISDGSKTLGVVNADAIATNLFNLIDTATDPSPSRDSKIGFVVASSSGKVITASYAFQAVQTANPAIAEALTNLAQQSKTQPTGIAQISGHLWAYRKIEAGDLLVIANLPEAEITSKLLLFVGGAAVGISAILAIAIFGFVNSLKNRLKPLSEECDRFLTEQGSTSIDNVSKDEIDRLAIALKKALHQVKTSEIKLRDELARTPDNTDISASQLQQNFAETELIEAEVGDLLDVVSSMEEGDLTIEAQVNDRATGLVADTLNRLREKLVEIISSVLGTAQQVAKGASDLEELARTVVLNTAEQAQSVTQGQALTEQVASIASRSAEQVSVANQSLQEVRDTVASGQTAINTLTDSISVLQTGSAQIVQRMKTLGEFVGLAEQFVQDQGQIASLTQVLALNATLVAARAAEQKDPKQFSGVAREFESIAGQVNDLATQTNDGLTVLQQRTSQIQTVVTAIDIEVQNLSGLVAGFTTGVEDSQSAFNSIQMATEEVVQIGQAITDSSTEIAEAAGSTASYISEIAQLADRTADLTRSARQQAEAMGNQAQQLLQGIQFFRLPATAPMTVPTSTQSNTNVNNFFDASTESNPEDTGGRVAIVPAIAVAAVVSGTAVMATSALSQSDRNDSADYTTTNSRIGDPDIANLDDEYYLDTESPQGLFSLDLEPDHDRDISIEANPLVAGENFAAPLLDDLSSQEVTSGSAYSNLTDISAIEESLLADLRHEIYDEDAVEDFPDRTFSDVESDLENDLDVDSPSLESQMEGVNEFAIVTSSSDPMIVSATSSFEDDTAFGNSPLLSEEKLANLPTSVDFTIPDLDDDDDFHIPKITIESTLDNSNSFFEADSVQQVDSNLDFDPFNTGDQAVTDSNDYSHGDDIFNSNSLEEDLSVSLASNTFEGDNNFTADELPNESLDDSWESLYSDSPNDALELSAGDLSFDEDLDEALNSSIYDETANEEPNDIFNISFTELSADITEEDEFYQYSNNIFEMDEANLLPNNEGGNLSSNQEDDIDLSTQVSDIYLPEPDDFLPEEVSLVLEEDLPSDASELVENNNSFNESSLIQDSYESGEPIDPFSTSISSVDFQEDFFGVASEIDSESTASEFTDPISDPISDPILESANEILETAFPSLFDEIEEELEENDDNSVWQSQIIASDLSETSNTFDFISTQDAESLDDPFDFFSTLLEDEHLPTETAIATEPEISEIPLSFVDESLEEPLLEANSFDFLNKILNESEAGEPNLNNDNADNSVERIADLQPEIINSNATNLLQDSPQSEILDFSDDFNANFELPSFSEAAAPDEPLSDEVFDFEIADDFSSLIDTMNEKVVPLVSVDDLLSDVGAEDLTSPTEASMTFDDNLIDDDLIDDELDVGNLDIDQQNSFDFNNLQPLVTDDQNSLDAFEEAIDLEGLSVEAASHNESLNFNEILESENPIPLDELDFEESAIFARLPNDLDTVTPEINSTELISEVTEASPDFSLNLSDNWLEEIVTDNDVNYDLNDLDGFANLSIEYPVIDEQFPQSSNESVYGFADDLLDSLMDESNDEFEKTDTLIESYQSSSDSDLMAIKVIEVEDSKTEDIFANNSPSSASKFSFDISKLESDDLVVTARNEIDDFLSSVIGVKASNEEIARTKSEQNPSSETDEKHPKS